MTKTNKLVPIAIGLACTAALLGAVIYEDMSLRSRAAMELRGRIESVADAIAAKLGQGLNVRFTFARALGAHIVSQNSSQNTTPAVGTGRFADLMTRNHGMVEALLAFPAGPDLPRAADDAKTPEVLLRGLEAGAGRAAFEQARTSSKPVVQTSAGFADGTARYLGARAAETFASDPVSKTARSPMGNWDLAAVPRDGWRPASPALTVFRILGVLMAGLVGLLAYFLARQPAKLRLIVDSAARELRAQKNELAIAQSRLSNAIDSIPEGFALYDGSGDLVASNRRYDRSEPFETSHGSCEVERHDGTWYRVQRETTPTGDLVIVQTDITAQKRHERELTEAKDQAEVAEAPAADGPGEAGGAVVPSPDPGPAGSGVRILIAEDNVANQMVIKHFLEMGGYRADVASNGLEAVHAARTRAYDLVLMDISMPEMDGITAAAEIRVLARTRDTMPIMVAVTAHALPRDRERFLAAGFDEVLVKPLRKDELFRALSKWLNVTPADPEVRRSLN